jgi:hypothetical protein
MVALVRFVVGVNPCFRQSLFWVVLMTSEMGSSHVDMTNSTIKKSDFFKKYDL